MPALVRFPRLVPLTFLLLLGLSGWALGEEPGHVFTYKDPAGVKIEVRKARKLERVGGFYIAHWFAGGTERLDAFLVGATVDLGALHPANLKQPDDIAKAKASEVRAEAATKRFPQLAPLVAPHLTQLRAEIVRAERGEKKVDGKWLTAEQAAALYAHGQGTVKRGVLHLKDKRTFRDVEIVAVNTQELRIMHSEGAATIPMNLVPEEFKREYLKALQPAGGK